MLPTIPGVAFVGRVSNIDSRTSIRYRIQKGDRVMSLCKTGGNTRYTRTYPDQLIKISDDLDPAETVCLAEAYLTAFQVLHFGQKQSTRFRANSLKGKSILILGVLTNVGRAIVELANQAGATLVYANGKEKQRDGIRDLGATPLGRRTVEWMPHLRGKLDLVIDATMDSEHGNLDTMEALNDRGTYVFIGRRMDFLDTDRTRRGPQVLMCSRRSARATDRIHNYDIFATWQDNLEECKVRIHSYKPGLVPAASSHKKVPPTERPQSPCVNAAIEPDQTSRSRSHAPEQGWAGA